MREHEKRTEEVIEEVTREVEWLVCDRCGAKSDAFPMLHIGYPDWCGWVSYVIMPYAQKQSSHLCPECAVDFNDFLIKRNY